MLRLCGHAADLRHLSRAGHDDVPGGPRPVRHGSGRPRARLFAALLIACDAADASRQPSARGNAARR
ncbi:hypothetical protein [Lysobacter gummosus]|uniref:hypothetical protein n=1 Tax=Lysobacter gummosus TaxID=262324 RepID=UPI00363F0B36